MKSLLLIFLAIILISVNGYPQDYKTIVAFGDSFTDNGYVDGHGFNRDSNGPVWVEYLAEMIDCQNIDNRAWGGARTDNGHYLGFDWSGFNWQVDNYNLTTNPEETLFTIWIGVNDYWDNKDNPSNSVKNIKNGLNKLIDKGGKHFVVVNNFDLTISLGYASSEEYRKLIPAVKELTKSFNEQLHTMLFDSKVGLMQSHPDITIHFVDIYSFMNELVSNNQFNQKQWKGTYQYPDPKKYLWYDEWHPMTSCHKLIGELVFKKIKK
jgi:phospholipase/lecithinase/hemolysin